MRKSVSLLALAVAVAIIAPMALAGSPNDRVTGGGQTLADEVGVPLLGSVPIEAAVAAAGDEGEPVVIDGTGPAADALRAIASRIVNETVPPVQMAGCSARQEPNAVPVALTALPFVAGLFLIPLSVETRGKPLPP